MSGPNKRVVTTGVMDCRVEYTDIPAPPPAGVVLKVQHAGVCHSDVHIHNGEIPDLKFPRVLGHEIGGSIHDIGEEAAKAYPGLQKGARVVVFPWNQCTKCNECCAGATSCTNMFLPTGTGGEGTYQYGIWQDGGFQNYMVVHEARFLIAVPDTLPMSQACLVPCGGVTAYSAVIGLKSTVERAIKVNGKANVGVFGAGGLGLWAIQIMKAILPSEVTIIAVDLIEEKLQDARAQGADVTYKWEKDADVKSVVEDYLKTVGAYLDGAIDFTGMASVQERIFSLLNVYGTMTVVGLAGATLAPVSTIGLIVKNITIQGNYVGTKTQCTELIDLITQGKVKPPPITDITLNDLEDTLSKLERGEQRGRAVIKM